MFTTTQANELIRDTTSIWTSLNGVNGRKFTSNSNASKYIFLPACGYWFNTTYKYIDDCYYLSTSIYVSYASNAWILYVSSGYSTLSNDLRYQGYPIRPIAPAQP